MIFVPLVAAVALSGTAVVDRTTTCQVPVQAGIPILTIRAAPTWLFVTNGQKGVVPAGLWAYANDRNGGGGVALVGVSNARQGYSPPASGWCTGAARIPLSHAGIPLDSIDRASSAGLGGGFGSRCMSATRVTIRLHATIRDGVPVAAQLAVRTGKKLRPIVFVDWTPTKVTSYLTSDCQS